MTSVSIRQRYNPNPNRRLSFTVKCGSHKISTTVTPTPAVVRSWLYRIRSYYRYVRRGTLVVGLGVQWRSSDYRAAVLQLCIGRHCLVFQLLHADRVPLSLRRFLSDPYVTFVGVWNFNDARMLLNSDHCLSVPELIDIRHVAAARLGFGLQMSMERLAGLILGMYGVSKPIEVGRSDWNVYWLSEEQVQYACVDAFLSFAMGKALHVWNWSNSQLLVTGRLREASFMDEDDEYYSDENDRYYSDENENGGFYLNEHAQTYSDEDEDMY